MDPALWAVLEGPADDMVAAIVRLVPGGQPPAGCRVVTRFGDICTVRLRRADLLRIRNDPAVLSCKAPRLMLPEPILGRQVGHDRAQRRASARSDRGAPEPRGKGVVVGVVDWGCDFTHPNFLDAAGRTRLLALWDQRAADGRPPMPYGYGVVHDRRRIDAALGTADPLDEVGYDLAEADPDGTGCHGTHVLDIAAGRPRLGPGGIATASDLVFVHLASPAWGPRSIGNSVTLLEAVDFIVRVAGSRPWVINLSMGSHGGPHDGTTAVELALDALAGSGPGRCIVQSCGNYGRRPIHTSGRLPEGSRIAIDWQIDPTDETENELEIWYPGGDELVASLVAPDRRLVARAPPNSHGTIVHGGVRIGHFGHRTRDPNNGDNHVDFFLNPVGGGHWRLVLQSQRSLDPNGVAYHVWIERDEVEPGSQSRLSQSIADYRSTTGTICNGHNTIVVGAVDQAAMKPAGFSSFGPTRDGRQKPDLLAPGTDIVAARSQPPIEDGSIGMREPSLTTKSGTSMAAPHVTGTAAVLYEAAGRPLHAHELKRILLETAKPVGLRGTTFGIGVLDVHGAVRRATQASSPSVAANQPLAATWREDDPTAPPQSVSTSLLNAAKLDAAVKKNPEYLEKLKIGKLTPFGTLDPAKDGAELAGRVAQVQHFARSRGLDLRYLGTKIDVDGILGYQTYLLLTRLAAEQAFATYLSNFGVEISNIERNKYSQEIAAVHHSPIRLYASKVLSIGGDLVVPALKRQFQSAPEVKPDDPNSGLRLERWNEIIGNFAQSLLGPRHSEVAWPKEPGKFIRLLELLLTGRSVRAFSVRVSAARSLRSIDGVVHRPDGEKIRLAGDKLIRTKGSAFTWIFDEGSPTLSRWKADLPLEARRSDSATRDPYVLAEERWGIGVTVYIPELTKSQIDDALQTIAQEAIASGLSAQSRAETNATAIRERVMSVRGRLTYDQCEELAFFIGQFEQNPADLENALDYLNAREKDAWPGRLIDVFVEMHFWAHRARLANVLEKTKFRSHPKFVEFKRKHQEKFEQTKIHRYDVARQTVFLEGKEDKAVVAEAAGGNLTCAPWCCVVGDVVGIYWKVTKPGELVFFKSDERREAWSKQTDSELAAMMREIGAAIKDEEKPPDESVMAKRVADLAIQLADGSQPPKQTTDDASGAERKKTIEALRVIARKMIDIGPSDELTEKDLGILFNVAADRAARTMSPPLDYNTDFESPESRVSLRVLKLRSRPAGSVTDAEIQSDLVIWRGGVWKPIPGTERWRSSDEFAEELAFFHIAQIAELINLIAKITIIVASGFFLAQTGLGTVLIRLGGGARNVLTFIGFNEVIYFIKGIYRGELSLNGVLEAGFEGYVQALGFRLARGLVSRGVGAFGFAGKFLRLGSAQVPASVGTGTRFLGGVSWLLQNAATGAVGGVLTPKLDLLIRDASFSAMLGENRFHSWSEYRSVRWEQAAYGALFEVAARIVPAVLGGTYQGIKNLRANSRAEMVKQLRNEGITLDDWILGTSTGMAEYSKLLRGVANPSSNLSVKRLLGSAVEVTKELGRSVKSELKLQVHRDLLEMSLQAELSGNAVLGLQRILKLKPADAAELVRALKQSPKLADSRLALLGTLDESLFGTAINKLGVRQVLASQPLADFMSLAGAGEARFLIEVHFRNSLRRFEEWSLAFNALAKDAQAIVLGVIRRHGFNVHPGVVTQLVKSGLPITPELLGAFGRIRRVLGEGMQFDRLNLVLQDAAKTNAADVARLLSSHATVKDAAIRNLSKLAQEGSSFGTVASRVNDLDTLMGLFERSRFDPDVLNSIVPQVWPRPGQALTAAERQGLERLLAAGSASGRRAAVAEKLRQVPADPQVKSQVLDVIGSATDEQVGLALRSDAFESFARAPTKQKLVEIAKPIKKTAPTAKPDIPIKPVDAAAVIAKAKASGLAGAESQFLDSVGAKLVNDLSQSVPKKTIEKYVTGTDVQRRGIVGWLKGKVQEAAFTLSDQFREIRAKIRTRHKELREELSNQDVQLGPLSFGRVGDNFGELTDGIFAAIGTHAKSGKRVLYVFSIFEMKSASNMRDLVNVVEIGGGSVPRVAGKTPARTSDPTLSGQVQKSRNRLDSGWSSFRDSRRRFDASEDEIELVILGEVGQKVRSEMYVVTPAGAHSQRQLTLLREQLLTQGMRVEMTTSPLSNDTYGNIAKWIVESMAGLL